MAIRTILNKKEDALRKKCRPIDRITPHLLTLLDDMRETVVDANGAGLAAPQVGVLRRIAVVVNENDEIFELINPEIVERRGEQQELEGCLSDPGEWGITSRPQWVKARAMNRQGEWYELEGEGLFARAICHEIDHLDGILFTDRVFAWL